MLTIDWNLFFLVCIYFAPNPTTFNVKAEQLLCLYFIVQLDKGKSGNCIQQTAFVLLY